jgi:hypothetical protein
LRIHLISLVLFFNLVNKIPAGTGDLVLCLNIPETRGDEATLFVSNEATDKIISGDCTGAVTCGDDGNVVVAHEAAVIMNSLDCPGAVTCGDVAYACLIHMGIKTYSAQGQNETKKVLRLEPISTLKDRMRRIVWEENVKDVIKYSHEKSVIRRLGKFLVA